jgi:hypothetical protein
MYAEIQIPRQFSDHTSRNVRVGEMRWFHDRPYGISTSSEQAGIVHECPGPWNFLHTGAKCPAIPFYGYDLEIPMRGAARGIRRAASFGNGTPFVRDE